MSRSIGWETAIPSRVKSRPPTVPVRAAVSTVSPMRRSSLAPKYRADSTPAPVPSPMSRLMSSSTRAPLEPTAARSVSPSNRPTTIRSAALKASCSTPESMTGTAKAMSLGRSLPRLKSISWARFTERPHKKQSTARRNQSSDITPGYAACQEAGKKRKNLPRPLVKSKKGVYDTKVQ